MNEKTRQSWDSQEDLFNKLTGVVENEKQYKPYIKDLKKNGGEVRRDIKITTRKEIHTFEVYDTKNNKVVDKLVFYKLNK